MKTETSIINQPDGSIAKCVLMIEPVSFGYNRQTAVNNFFQKESDISPEIIQRDALEEFQAMTAQLRANGIEVIVIKDTLHPHKPDSIFPNNWVSFHEGGLVVIYPMFAANRRLERRIEILDIIETHGKIINNVNNISVWEEDKRFLEGTGSLVLDRKNGIAYASLSGRTDQSAVEQYCRIYNYEPILFTARHTVNGKRKNVYHTNVMMCVADKFAIICLTSIDDPAERTTVTEYLTRTGKEIIEISEEQMHCFAGNMLQLQNDSGKRFLVMSQSAHDSLTGNQIDKLKSFNELITCSIPTIEQVGGGSVRCMMAEIL
ncbi:citrulline utilization hydrolase CtlX [Paludibacter jiangxiensis]|uniref:Amidinotransferase n=1 Tax=Paludibacter jiangxiensis TaxID=681398 RepID=A0A170YBV4_9BACT|nr:arginine deiminase-related protein [Paludibacter jiangxiensis]GAT61674.1 hypothetical protein PJIAN_1254 [Paludibacter jiangxiensis]